ncbi:MAG: efflux RND transporter periplasmic adaptor subunit [Chlamydiales bacterium]
MIKGTPYHLRVLIAGFFFFVFIVFILVLRSPSPFGIDLTQSNIDLTPTVGVIQVHYQDQYHYNKEFIGQVEAQQKSAIGFELTGVIETILVEEGDRVVKNEVLARLDTKRLNAELKEAKATLNRSKAEAELAQTTFKRTEEALAENAVSAQELDEAKEKKESAQAQVEVNEARVETIEIKIDKSTLFAPYEGIIIRRFVDEGVVINPGEKVLEVQKTGPLDIRVGVTPEVARQLKLGEVYKLEILDMEVPAKIYSILPLVGKSRTVDVILKTENPPPEIRPGNLTRLLFPETVHTRGFWVPLSALTEGRRGLWTLYVLENTEQTDTLKDHIFPITRRHVEIIHIESEDAFVVGTVDDNEWFVSQGTHKLVPGIDVKVVSISNKDTHE